VALVETHWDGHGDCDGKCEPSIRRGYSARWSFGEGPPLTVSRAAEHFSLSEASQAHSIFDYIVHATAIHDDISSSD
jgi:hypothetical protein